MAKQPHPFDDDWKPQRAATATAHPFDEDWTPTPQPVQPVEPIDLNNTGWQMDIPQPAGADTRTQFAIGEGPNPAPPPQAAAPVAAQPDPDAFRTDYQTSVPLTVTPTMTSGGYAATPPYDPNYNPEGVDRGVGPEGIANDQRAAAIGNLPLPVQRLLAESGQVNPNVGTLEDGPNPGFFGKLLGLLPSRGPARGIKTGVVQYANDVIEPMANIANKVVPGVDLSGPPEGLAGVYQMTDPAQTPTERISDVAGRIAALPAEFASLGGLNPVGQAVSGVGKAVGGLAKLPAELALFTAIQQAAKGASPGTIAQESVMAAPNMAIHAAQAVPAAIDAASKGDYAGAVEAGEPALALGVLAGKDAVAKRIVPWLRGKANGRNSEVRASTDATTGKPTPTQGTGEVAPQTPPTSNAGGENLVERSRPTGGATGSAVVNPSFVPSFDALIPANSGIQVAPDLGMMLESKPTVEPKPAVLPPFFRRPLDAIPAQETRPPVPTPEAKPVPEAAQVPVVKQPWENAKVEDEGRWYGSTVDVIPEFKYEEPYTGKITRVLNNGEVIEVQPDGADTSFRVRAERIKPIEIVDAGPKVEKAKPVEKQQPAKVFDPIQDPWRFAEILKSQGVDRQTSWSHFVQAWGLRGTELPMSAPEWYKIYDQAKSIPDTPGPATSVAPADAATGPVVKPNPSSGQAAPPISPGESAPPAVLKQPAKPIYKMSKGEFNKKYAIHFDVRDGDAASRIESMRKGINTGWVGPDINLDPNYGGYTPRALARGWATFGGLDKPGNIGYVIPWKSVQKGHPAMKGGTVPADYAVLSREGQSIHEAIVERAIKDGLIQSHPDYPNLKPDVSTPNPERTVIQRGKEEEGQGRQGLLSPSEAQPPASGGESAPVAPSPKPETIGLSLRENERIRDALHMEGAPPATHRARRPFYEKAIEQKYDRDAMDIAARAIDGDLSIPLEDVPVVHAGMILKAAEIKKGIEQARETADTLRNGGDTAGADWEANRAVNLESQMNTLLRGSREIGAMQSQGFSFRGSGITTDTHEFVPVMARATEANKGRPIEAKDRAEFSRLTDEIKQRDTEIERLTKAAADREIEIEKKLAEAVIQSELKKSRITKQTTESVARIRKSRADIKDQLRNMGLRVNDITGVGPEGAYLIGRLAVSYIREGVVVLGDVVKKVMADIPGLSERDVWQALNARSPKKMAEAEKAALAQIKELKNQARILDEIEYAKTGVYGPGSLKKPGKASNTVATLRAELNKIRDEAGLRKDMTPAKIKQVQDRIAEVEKELAGGYRKLPAQIPQPTGELKVAKDKLAALRDMMRKDDTLMHWEARLRDAEQGVFDTKPTLRKPQPERLQEIKGRVRDLESKATRPERDAKRISTLESILGKAQRGEFAPRKSRGPQNTVIADLQSQIRKLRSQSEQGARTQQRIARLQDAIKRAEAGQFDAPKPRPVTPDSVKALQKKLTELRNVAYKSMRDGKKLEKAVNKINEIQDQLDRGYRALKKSKGVIPQDLKDAQNKISDLRYSMKVGDDVTDLENQLRTRNFKEAAARRERPIDPTLRRKLIDRDKLKRQVDERIETIRSQAEYDAKSKTGKVFHVARMFGKGATNELRSIAATADASATLRQGLVLASTRPIEATKAFVQASRAALSPAHAENVMADIARSDTYHVAVDAGLKFSELDGPSNFREEYFRGKLAEHLPGVKASGRHMTIYLNLLRKSAFDQFLETNPNATPKELSAWADFVNKASGKGDLQSLGISGKALSNLFFAPKFAASRFQTPAAIVKHWSEPRVRKAIAKDMAATLAIGSTALTLAAMAGAKVGLDPRDPDFGKIVVGNTRVDVWAGFQQPARLLLSGGFNLTDRLGLTSGPKKDVERFDPVEAIGRFASYKMNPAITLAHDMWTGRNIVGQKIDRKEAAAESLLPLIVRETRDAYYSGGNKAAAGSGFLSFFGVGTSTYDKKKKDAR